jgi:hypothetical protein
MPDSVESDNHDPGQFDHVPLADPYTKIIVVKPEINKKYRTEVICAAA